MALDVYRDWLNIKSPERPPDYYTLLGIQRFEDDRSVVQTKYRQCGTNVRRYATGKFSKQSQDLLDELARAMLTLTDPARKAEYDRKLGRKSKRPPLEKRSMCEILLADHIISAVQLKETQELADSLGIDLRQALVQKQIVPWDEATRALAQQHNLPYLDLTAHRIAPELMDSIPADIARRENLFPLLVDEGTLLVAVTHALNLETLEVLRFRAGMPIRAVLCSPPAIRALVEKHYPLETKGERAAQQAPEDEQETEVSEGVSLAGWLWRNVKWLGPVLVVGAAAGGYFAFGLTAAVAAALIVVALVTTLLFTLK